MRNLVYPLLRGYFFLKKIKMSTFEGLSKVQDLLHTVDRPFENIAIEFKGLVPEQKRFEAACALMALLEDGKSQVCLKNNAIRKFLFSTCYIKYYILYFEINICF